MTRTIPLGCMNFIYNLLKGSAKAKSSVIPISTHGVSTCKLKGECEELMENPKYVGHMAVKVKNKK